MCIYKKAAKKSAGNATPIQNKKKIRKNAAPAREKSGAALDLAANLD